MTRNTPPGVIGDDSEAAYGYCRCVPSLVSMRRMRMGQAIVVWRQVSLYCGAHSSATDLLAAVDRAARKDVVRQAGRGGKNHRTT